MTFYAFYSFGTSPQCDKVLCIRFTNLKSFSLVPDLVRLRTFTLNWPNLKCYWWLLNNLVWGLRVSYISAVQLPEFTLFMLCTINASCLALWYEYLQYHLASFFCSNIEWWLVSATICAFLNAEGNIDFSQILLLIWKTIRACIPTSQFSFHKPDKFPILQPAICKACHKTSSRQAVLVRFNVRLLHFLCLYIH